MKHHSEHIARLNNQILVARPVGHITELPLNMSVTWHQGDFSICEVERREKRTYEDGSRFYAGLPKIIKYERNETEQLPEELFKSLFMWTAGEALRNPDSGFHYIRNDNRKFTTENLNNEPYYATKNFIKCFNIYGLRFNQGIGGEKI